MNRIIASALGAFFVLFPCLAHAQASSAPIVAPCVTAIPSPSNPNAIPYCAPVTANNPLPTTGGGSGGSTTPYLQTNVYTPITTGASSTTTAITAGTPAVVVAVNVGTTNGAYCGPGGPATSAWHYLSPGGGWFAWNPNAATTFACIQSNGATTVNVTGGSGGLPTGSGGGGGTGGGSVAADTPLTPTGTISGVNNFSTGLQIGNTQNGRVTLFNSPTTNSVLAFTALSGWNSGQIACSGGGTQGTNQYEVDITPDGTTWRRVKTFTGPTASIPVNLAGMIAVNIVADVWSSGAPTCGMRVSVNQAIPDDYANLFQATQSAAVSFNTGATVQLLPAIIGQGYIVTAANFMAAGTTNVTFEYGTGTNCGTGTTVLTGAYPLTAQQGVSLGGGNQLVIPAAAAGNALCAINSQAIQVSGSLAYTTW